MEHLASALSCTVQIVCVDGVLGLVFSSRHLKRVNLILVGICFSMLGTPWTVILCASRVSRAGSGHEQIYHLK